MPRTGFSLVAVSGGYSSLRCAGFSLRWLLLLRSTDSKLTGFSSCGSRALECRLSSCGTRALLLRGMWDLPGQGLKPVSPALAGGFLTTAPPGKSHKGILIGRLQIGQLRFHLTAGPLRNHVEHASDLCCSLLPRTGGWSMNPSTPVFCWLRVARGGDNSLAFFSFWQ